MDSITYIKGYTTVKFVPEEYVDPETRARRRVAAVVACSATVLFSLVVGLIVLAVVHEPDPESSPLAPVRTVCEVTRYPTTCVSSLTSPEGPPGPPGADPETIFERSLRVSAAELSRVGSAVQAMAAGVNGGKGAPEAVALVDCKSQIDDALVRLNDSATAAAGGLTGAKIADITTWISAALTDQETCVDGLEEVGSTAVDEVRAKMQNSKELISNSLAIITHIRDLFDKFGLKLH